MLSGSLPHFCLNVALNVKNVWLSLGGRFTRSVSVEFDVITSM